MKDEAKFKTNKFFFYAQRYAENLTTDAEIRTIDMTDEFWKEIEQEIINDELVDLNINAKVRMGKSTTGIQVGMEIFALMLKHKKRKEDNFGIQNIARDEQEYSRKMRDPNTAFTVIVTDEIDELSGTGENVTVERALYNVFSNVQAGRYVHRVSCSPKGVTDPNADVFLEIISVDREKRITHAHLYYRMFKGGNEYMQLLGYINVYVGDLIKVWEDKVKKHFLKNKKTDYDNKVINYWRKRDFYTEYMIRKYEKMELITKEGIMRPRLLDYSKVILKVEEKLRPLARINVLTKSTLKNYVKMYCRKNKIATSIVGEELMTQEVDGILSLWKSYFKMCRDLISITEQLDKGKLDKDTYDGRRVVIEDIQKEIMETIQAQLGELQRYADIYERYHLEYNDGQHNKKTEKNKSKRKKSDKRQIEDNGKGKEEKNKR